MARACALTLPLIYCPRQSKSSFSRHLTRDTTVWVVTRTPRVRLLAQSWLVAPQRNVHCGGTHPLLCTNSCAQQKGELGNGVGQGEGSIYYTGLRGWGVCTGGGTRCVSVLRHALAPPRHARVWEAGQVVRASLHPCCQVCEWTQRARRLHGTCTWDQGWIRAGADVDRNSQTTPGRRTQTPAPTKIHTQHNNWVAIRACTQKRKITSRPHTTQHSTAH